jgi:hypothetical protein
MHKLKPIILDFCCIRCKTRKNNIKKNEREFKKHFEGIAERVKGSKKSEIL